LKQLTEFIERNLNAPYIYLCLLPIIVGIADYLENFGIITMLKSYSELTKLSVRTTSLFSVIKSTSTSLFFMVLIILLLIMGFKAIFGKNLGQLNNRPDAWESTPSKLYNQK